MRSTECPSSSLCIDIKVLDASSVLNQLPLPESVNSSSNLSVPRWSSRPVIVGVPTGCPSAASWTASTQTDVPWASPSTAAPQPCCRAANWTPRLTWLASTTSSSKTSPSSSPTRSCRSKQQQQQQQGHYIHPWPTTRPSHSRTIIWCRRMWRLDVLTLNL